MQMQGIEQNTVDQQQFTKQLVDSLSNANTLYSQIQLALSTLKSGQQNKPQENIYEKPQEYNSDKIQEDFNWQNTDDLSLKISYDFNTKKSYDFLSSKQIDHLEISTYQQVQQRSRGIDTKKTLKQYTTDDLNEKVRESLEKQEFDDNLKQKERKQFGELFIKNNYVEIFNNINTWVGIKYNNEENALSIIKQIKEIENNSFGTEINVCNQLAQKDITLNLISYCQDNILLFEQVAGQKDFSRMRNDYQLHNTEYKDQYIQNMIILFSQLFKKHDDMIKQGYVHSDIKPSNLVLGFNLKPYFIDFEGATKLNEPYKYFNYYTSYFNLKKYYLNEQDNTKRIYKFKNEKEIIQCDRIQLALSFLSMILVHYQQIINSENKNGILQNIIDLEQFFKDQNFHELIKIIYEKEQSHNEDIRLILGIIELNEQIDYYDKIIKERIYELANLKGDFQIFQDFIFPSDSNQKYPILKRANDINKPMALALKQQYGQVIIQHQL